MNDEERFGHSLALKDGDLVLEEGSLLTVRGKRNLLQALELRVLTPLADDRFNTTYGLDVRQAFTQPGSIRLVKELIKLNLVRTLATDPRVRDVREVLFVDDPAYLAQHPERDPNAAKMNRQRRLWRVEVLIETVDGQTETLPVTIGV
jgi:hypothetical protein